MSVSGGLASMMAGSVAAQTQAERTASQDKRSHTFAAAQRAADSKEKVLKAEGLAEAQAESEHAGDRDADGRLPWERRHRPPHDAQHQPAPHQSIDPTGQSGRSLDLSG